MLLPLHAPISASLPLPLLPLHTPTFASLPLSAHLVSLFDTSFPLPTLVLQSGISWPLHSPLLLTLTPPLPAPPQRSSVSSYKPWPRPPPPRAATARAYPASPPPSRQHVGVSRPTGRRLQPRHGRRRAPAWPSAYLCAYGCQGARAVTTRPHGPGSQVHGL